MSNPRQYKIPDWFLNRQKDVKDGKYSQVSTVFEIHAGPSARDHQLWRRSSNSSEFVARRSTKCLKQGIKTYESLKIKLY